MLVLHSQVCSTGVELITMVIREDQGNRIGLTQHENIHGLFIKLAVVLSTKFVEPILNSFLVYCKLLIACCPIALLLPFHL